MTTSDGGGVVTGVTVEAVAADDPSRVLASTVSYGKYAMDVPTGSVLVRFSGAGYPTQLMRDSAAAAPQAIRVDPDRDLELGEWTMQPSSGEVAGRVADSQGRPVTGAWIQIRSGDAILREARSDADGRYAIAWVPAGVVQIAISPDWADRSFIPDELPYWGDSRQVPQATSDGRAITVLEDRVTTVDERLSRPGGLAGTVRDARGNPMAGVRVIVEREFTPWLGIPSDAATTNAAGRWSKTGLVVVPHALQFRTPLAIGKNLMADVPDGATGTVDVTLAAGGTVSGTVVDSAGAPVADALVMVHPSEGYFQQGQTDGNGAYRVGGIAPTARAVVEARKPGFEPSMGPEFTITGTETIAGPAFVLYRSGEPRLDRSVRLRLRRRSVVVPIACPASCRVTLTARGKRLATGRAAVRATTARLALTKAGRRRVSRSRSMRAQLVARPPQGPTRRFAVRIAGHRR